MNIVRKAKKAIWLEGIFSYKRIAPRSTRRSRSVL